MKCPFFLPPKQNFGGWTIASTPTASFKDVIYMAVGLRVYPLSGMSCLGGANRRTPASEPWLKLHAQRIKPPLVVDSPLSLARRNVTSQASSGESKVACSLDTRFLNPELRLLVERFERTPGFRFRTLDSEVPVVSRLELFLTSIISSYSFV